MLFIIVAYLITVVICFFIGGFILNWSTKISGIENFKYKNSLLILFISGLASFLVRFIFIFGLKIEILGSILALTASFFIFHYFIKKYSQANWKKTLKIYTIFNIIFFIFAFITIMIFRMFILEPFVMKGVSMNPTYIENDYLLINKFDKSFNRNDVIIYKDKKVRGHNIKRIVGLPKEKIEIKENKVFINGKILKEDFIKDETRGNISLVLKENEYFTLGDNRNHSADSRASGPVKLNAIRGSVFYKNSKIMQIMGF